MFWFLIHYTNFISIIWSCAGDSTSWEILFWWRNREEVYVGVGVVKCVCPEKTQLFDILSLSGSTLIRRVGDMSDTVRKQLQTIAEKNTFLLHWMRVLMWEIPVSYLREVDSEFNTTEDFRVSTEKQRARTPSKRSMTHWESWVFPGRSSPPWPRMAPRAWLDIKLVS